MAQKRDIPASFRDPFWSDISAKAEKKVGIPGGLLRSILLHGEKSNRDDVSSDGARTPFQIIPSTRQDFLDRHGIDAYLSPENAAEVAALHLKESLDRNQGDIEAAAGEYFAGDDRKKWGPKTADYQRRVMAGYEEEHSARLQRTYARMANAYASGAMSPEQRVAYEQEIQAGNIPKPEGLDIQLAKPEPQQAPPRLVEAYRAGTLSPEQRAEVDRLVEVGELQMPAEPEPETTAGGIMGAIARGGAPAALGAVGGGLLGGAVGALGGGVGAIPGVAAGAALGAGAAPLAYSIGDVLAAGYNQLFGGNVAAPSQALEAQLTEAGVPEAQTQAERIIQVGTAGATGGAGSAIAGRTLAQVGTTPLVRGIGQMMAEQPVTQTIAGGTSGISSQVAQEAGLPAPLQIAAALGGGALGARAARLPTIQQTPRSAEMVSQIAQAERAGIPLMTSDVSAPKTFIAKWLRERTEQIPIVGTGPVRATQQQKRIDAVKDLLTDFDAHQVAQASDDILEAVSKDLGKTRGATISKYKNIKDEIISDLSGSGPVDVLNTLSEIDNQISRLQGLKTKTADPAIEILEDWKGAIQNQGIENIESLRKSIGEAFTRPELSAIRSEGEKALSKIYSPLRADIEGHIEANAGKPGLTKWRVANKNLSETAKDLEQRTMRSVLRTGSSTPEDISKLLFSRKPSEIRLLYKNLSPEGRANARIAILQKAVERSGGFDEISPDKFKNRVNELGKSIGVFFKGEELNQVEGLAKTLKLTERAAQAGVSPPTGAQVAPLAVAALSDALGSGGAALGGLASAGVASRIYESAPVRNLLVKMAKVRPGSPEEAALLKRVLSAIETAKIQQEKKESK